jgi:hypothetical protein
LLHVIEEIHGVSQQEEKPFYERLERIARRHLQTLGKVFDDRQIPWQVEVCCGRRAQDTVRVASEKQVDLIILTSPRYDPDNPRQSWGEPELSDHVSGPVPGAPDPLTVLPFPRAAGPGRFAYLPPNGAMLLFDRLWSNRLPWMLCISSMPRSSPA